MDGERLAERGKQMRMEAVDDGLVRVRETIDDKSHKDTGDAHNHKK